MAASSKDIYEWNVYASNMYQSGVYRGIGVTIDLAYGLCIEAVQVTQPFIEAVEVKQPYIEVVQIGCD